MSESHPLRAEYDLPSWHPARGSAPSNGAYQCAVCQGIAFNPVCPYCEENEEDEE